MSTHLTHKTLHAALLGLGLMAGGGCEDADEPLSLDMTDEEEDEADFRIFTPPNLPDTLLPTSLNTSVNTPSFSAVVATTEVLAAEAGRDILAAGGNAIDAAYAVQAVLNVVEPQSSGLGGGAMWMIYLAPTAGQPAGQVHVVDCREVAPAAAKPDMLSGSTTDLKSTSGISVGVPGALRCMEHARAQWGTGITRGDLLNRAITLADGGFKISSRLADAIDSSRLSKEPGNPKYEEARQVFRPGGDSLEAGDSLIQTDLADTLEQIASRGLDAFYDWNDVSGIAKAIVATQTARRSNYSGGTGRMAREDLEYYKLNGLRLSAPLVRQYREYTIMAPPPPTSGVFLLQMLGILDGDEPNEGFPIGTGNYGFGSFFTLNVMQEAMRLAFADRAFWLGDPAFVSVPTTGLLHDDYLDTRRDLITPGKRRSSITRGDPRPFTAGKQSDIPLAKQATTDEHEGADTTHWVVADAKGNVVNVTSTVSDLWGTGLMVENHGFMLNDQLLNFNDTPTFDDSPFNPGANDVAPHKRPRTTVSPTMVLLQGKLVAAFGSPGGTTIINAVLGFLLNLSDHNFSLQKSVAEERLSLDSASGTAQTEIESGFSVQVRKQLQKLGYKFTTVSAIGAIQAAIINPFDGKKFATADPRRLGAVRGISQ